MGRSMMLMVLVAAATAAVHAQEIGQPQKGRELAQQLSPSVMLSERIKMPRRIQAHRAS